VSAILEAFRPRSQPQGLQWLSTLDPRGQRASDERDEPASVLGIADRARGDLRRLEVEIGAGALGVLARCPRNSRRSITQRLREELTCRDVSLRDGLEIPRT
jgi:hypothetical protein